jgi:outer membrane biogenesis lipoprotein LolB
MRIGHCALLAVVLTACAKPRLNLPGDPGVPLTDFQQVHASVSMACAGVRTMTAELGLSGRACQQKLRGRVVAGFERPASMRLEGVAPFGAPAFILAARGGTAVLWLPRDGQVVRGATAEAMLGALTGVTLAPSDLQAILTGCVVAEPKATAGRVHANGWASIDLDGGATLFLQRSGNAWAVRAARRSGWQIEYPAWQGSFPAATRLQSLDTAAQVDLTATVSQLEINIDIDAAAFTLTVPADAGTMTIDDLRAAGPLRGQ